MAEARATPIPESVFKAAHAAGADWGLAVKACMDQLEPLPAGANLGFVYATDPLAADLGSIVTFLRERTKIEDWVGTVGFGVSAMGVEYHDRPALAVMTAALPAGSFHVFESIKAAGEGVGGDAGAWAREARPMVAVVHGDPRNPDIAEIVHDVSALLPGFLIGGLSASRGDMPQVAGRVTEGGLSGLLLGPDLGVAAGLSQGCSPIGPLRRITEAEHNIIMAIDRRPALEVFKEDIGELLAQDLRRVAGYIFVGFPIAGSDTGDYLVRNLIGIDPEQGWLQVGELVEEDRPILFCRRDHESARKDLLRMLRDVAGRAGPKPKAGLYFSCVARGQNLFGPNSEELKLVQQELGDIPLVGFFANGEISNDRLYGYTGVLALFL